MSLRRRVSVAIATAALVLTLLVALPARPAEAAAQPCPWVGSSAPIEQRVNAVLARMTLDDEIAMVHGASGSAYVGYVPANAAPLRPRRWRACTDGGDRSSGTAPERARIATSHGNPRLSSAIIDGSSGSRKPQKPACAGLPSIWS